MKLLRYVSVLFFVFALSSCNIINKDESVPTYININSIDLVENSSNCGGLNHNFTDVRVWVNSTLIGLFELPATIPVLAEGDAVITVAAGVKNMGISTDRMNYPFTKLYNITETLLPDQTIEIAPVMEYYEDISLWQENFADIGVSFEDQSGEISIVEDSSLDSCPLEDILVAKLTTIGESDIVEIASSIFLPVTGSGHTFLELNYKNEETFYIGIQTGETEQDKTYFIGINPSNVNGDLVWKKIYIELAPYMHQLDLGNIANFKLLFKSQLSNSESILLLDNIKLINR